MSRIDQCLTTSMPDQFSIKYAQLRAQLDKLEEMDSEHEQRQEKLLINLQKIQDAAAERRRKAYYYEELLSVKSKCLCAYSFHCALLSAEIQDKAMIILDCKPRTRKSSRQTCCSPFSDEQIQTNRNLIPCDATAYGGEQPVRVRDTAREMLVERFDGRLEPKARLAKASQKWCTTFPRYRKLVGICLVRSERPSAQK